MHCIEWSGSSSVVTSVEMSDTTITGKIFIDLR